jgi:hypothetical protein
MLANDGPIGLAAPMKQMLIITAINAYSIDAVPTSFLVKFLKASIAGVPIFYSTYSVHTSNVIP